MQAAILDAIQNRRSIREFTGEPVGVEQLHEIVTAGTWAPSGLNNQPWRFKLVVDAPTRAALARQTTYGHVILAAPALIVVYLDGEARYARSKITRRRGPASRTCSWPSRPWGWAGSGWGRS